ncbi:MAG: GyrI-like domain-containing protein [Candidatus Bathyarchaeia archaeon]|jgi:AraC family transcriptional regulator
MELQVTITPELTLQLLGCVYYGDPFHQAKEWAIENEIGKLWQRFMNLCQKYSNLLAGISSQPNIGYEVHIEPEEYLATRKYYVFAGVQVTSIQEIPLEMFVKVLPKTRYATFTTKVADEKTGLYVLKEWLPQNGLEQAYPYIIEAYNAERFRGVDDPQSEVDWYIPVKEKPQHVL